MLVFVNLESLQLYCDIVRLHSFSRGAVEHGISQSAASQNVQQIETELQVRLLDRSKRPFSLTPQGRKFYETCRSILKNFEDTRAEITGTRQEFSGTVRVAAIYSVGLHGMNSHMRRFLSEYPRVRLRLACLHPKEVVEAVLSDEADLGVLSYPPAKRALSIVPLHSDPLVFVCSPTHHMAQREMATARDLHEEPFIAFQGTLAVRKAIDRALRKHDVRPAIVMEFDNVETIKQAIAIGTGVGLLPARTVEKEAGSGSLVSLPFTNPSLERPIAVIHRRNKPLSPAVRRFLEQLQEDAVSIAQI